MHERKQQWFNSRYLGCITQSNLGRDSSVGIVIRYGLDGPGIEALVGRRDFPHPSRPALGPTQPPVQWGTGSFPGVKRPGRGVDHTPPPCAEVKERVELYLYSPSRPSWPVMWEIYLYLYFSQMLRSSWKGLQKLSILYNGFNWWLHADSYDRWQYSLWSKEMLKDVATLQSPWQCRTLSTSSCIPMNFKIPDVNIHWNCHFVLFDYGYDVWLCLENRLQD